MLPLHEVSASGDAGIWTFYAARRTESEALGKLEAAAIWNIKGAEAATGHMTFAAAVVTETQEAFARLDAKIARTQLSNSRLIYPKIDRNNDPSFASVCPVDFCRPVDLAKTKRQKSKDGDYSVSSSVAARANMHVGKAAPLTTLGIHVDDQIDYWPFAMQMDLISESADPP